MVEVRTNSAWTDPRVRAFVSKRYRTIWVKAFFLSLFVAICIVSFEFGARSQSTILTVFGFFWSTPFDLLLGHSNRAAVGSLSSSSFSTQDSTDATKRFLYPNNDRVHLQADAGQRTDPSGIVRRSSRIAFVQH